VTNGGDELIIDAAPIGDAPFEGVDSAEWTDLIERGRARGVLHAEEITHVLRKVELSGDVLAAVHREGEVVSSSHEDGGVRVRARLADASTGRLSEFVVASDDA
jgi:hypothetical protein